MSSETPLDRYFEILNTTAATIDGFEKLFTEDAEFMYGGEVFRGRAEVVSFHRELIARRKKSTYSWTVTAEGEGRIAARWSEVGLGAQGDQVSSGGTAIVVPASDGRIAKLQMSFTVGDAVGADRARIILSRHLEIWQIPDPEERLKKMGEAYAKDVKFVEADVFVGHSAISDYITRILGVAPLVVLKVESFFYHHDYVLFEWSWKNTQGVTAGGWDTIHFDGDLIETVVVFSSEMDVIDGTSAA